MKPPGQRSLALFLLCLALTPKALADNEADISASSGSQTASAASASVLSLPDVNLASNAVPTVRTAALRQKRIDAVNAARESQLLCTEAEKYRLGHGGVVQDGRKAVELYKQAAKMNAGAGSAAAMSTLARMYQIGWDGKSDLNELPYVRNSVQSSIGSKLRRLLHINSAALDSHATAAAAPWTSGHRPGDYVVAPDMHEAVRLWQEAAALGNATAQSILGALHAHGVFGVPLDAARSAVLYTFAAMGGAQEAMVVMGHKYHTGQGVPKDCKASVAHYMAPAEASARAAESTRGLSLLVPLVHRERLSDEVLETLTSGLLEGGAGADGVGMLAYYKNNAEKGDTQAHVALGHLYMLGARGVPQDHTQAAEHFLAAAEAGDTLSLANLGFLHMQGLGVEKSDVDAAAFVKEAAEAGMAAALNTLGVLTLYGRGGVPQDVAAGYAMLKKAAESGFPDAAYNLGLLHANGDAPGGRDFRSALQYFRLAASAGHVMALYRVAVMSANGLGAQADCHAAQQNLHTAIHRSPSSSLLLANGYRLLSAGNVAGALVEYLRAAELGLELGAWNAAYLLQEGLVPGMGDDPSPIELDASHVYFASLHNGTAAAAAPLPSEYDSAQAHKQGREQPAAPLEAVRVAEEAVGPSHQGAAPGPTPMRPAQQVGDEEMRARQQQAEGHSRGWSPSVADTIALWKSLLGWGTSRTGLGQGRCQDPRVQRKALRLLQRCAAQGNGAAELQIGDYHYYGLGGLNKSAETAVEHYRLACAHHVAQACFNLGWAHEAGSGVPVDDHLAKRFYDSALEEQKAARMGGLQSGVPVRLALWRLQGKEGLTWWRDTVVRPLFSLLRMGRVADSLNTLLNLPKYTPKPSKGSSKSSKADDKGVKSATVSKGRAQGGVSSASTAGSPSVPPPGTRTPAPVEAGPSKDPKARVKAVLEKNKQAKKAGKPASVGMPASLAAAGEYMAQGFLGGVVQAVQQVAATCSYILGRPTLPGFTPDPLLANLMRMLMCLLFLYGVLLGLRHRRRQRGGQ